MEVRHLHPWDVSYHQAVQIQERLRPRLVLGKLPRRIRHVAGADVSFSKKTGQVWAAVLVFHYPRLSMVEAKWVRQRARFPYVPGLLSFRELPVLLQAMARLQTDPDLVLCDGQGIAHPRGMGLASHLGLFLDRPTVGCAKSRLVGEYGEVGIEKGSHAPLWYEGRVVGAVLRTRRAVRPLFVSPGHRITLEESVNMVLGCCGKYRLPEPIRQAHLLVTQLRRRQGGA